MIRKRREYQRDTQTDKSTMPWPQNKKDKQINSTKNNIEKQRLSKTNTTNKLKISGAAEW